MICPDCGEEVPIEVPAARLMRHGPEHADCGGSHEPVQHPVETMYQDQLREIWAWAKGATAAGIVQQDWYKRLEKTYGTK